MSNTACVKQNHRNGKIGTCQAMVKQRPRELGPFGGSPTDAICRPFAYCFSGRT